MYPSILCLSCIYIIIQRRQIPYMMLLIIHFLWNNSYVQNDIIACWFVQKICFGVFDMAFIQVKREVLFICLVSIRLTAKTSVQIVLNCFLTDDKKIYADTKNKTSNVLILAIKLFKKRNYKYNFKVTGITNLYFVVDICDNR